MYQKLKSFLADDAVFTVILVLLVGVVSFGLGRLSVTSVDVVESDKPEIAFYEAVESTGLDFSNTEITANTVVASKNGTKYHAATCPGASQIKEENKIYFNSPSLAKAAGYLPAANCPDLQ